MKEKEKDPASHEERWGFSMEEAIEGRTYDHSSINPIILVLKHVCSEHYHSPPGHDAIVDCGLSYPGLGNTIGAEPGLSQHTFLIQ
jgi:hypothetical protein